MATATDSFGLRLQPASPLVVEAGARVLVVGSAIFGAAGGVTTL